MVRRLVDNPKGFLLWMAGAGIEGGTSFGGTDEIGYRAAVDPVTVHDLHATMLHLLDSITNSSRTSITAAATA